MASINESGVNDTFLKVCIAIVMVSVYGGGKNLVNGYSKLRWRSRTKRFGFYCVMGVAIACLCWTALAGAVPAQSTDAAASSDSAPEEAAPEEPNLPKSPQDLLPNNPVTQPFRNLAPPEVKQIFENDNPEAEIASVYLDGRSLFEVAAPTDSGSLTASERAQQIEGRLEDIAAEFADSDRLESLDVSVQIDEESNQPVIYVNGDALMTITYLDARLNGSNSLTLRAAQIADLVNEALRRFYQERQADYLWQQVRWAMATLFITLLASYAVSHFYHNLDQRRRLLKQQHQQSEPPGAAEADGSVLPMTAQNIRITLLTRQKINSLTVLKQFLRLLQILLWIASGLLILGYFPYTRWLQPLVIDIMRLPFRFILITLIAYGLIRFSGIWIDRLFIAFQSRTAATIERSQRLVLRLSTFSQVIKGITAFGIGSIAFLIMLSLLGVRVAPLLAGAGLLGFAVSFASQSLIKDIINGFLVLLEDQYGVGDVITVKGLSGFVENMNLRITQLRATDGQLITIPNGQIDIVQNLSKEWSRVDLMIPVGLAADIDKALCLVESVANDMRKDEIWGMLILEPPLLLGVDELNHAGATIRIWIKTQPMKQWDVAREYRRRLKIAFEAANIPIGVPQQIVYVSGAPEQGSSMLAEDLPKNGHASERSPSSPVNTP